MTYRYYLGLSLALGALLPEAHAAETVPTIEVPLLYSAVLEFNRPPTRAARGDQSAFAVERTDSRILVRPLRKEAKTNLVLFFSGGELFQVLLSSKANEPGSLIYHFDFPKVEPPPAPDTLRFRKIVRAPSISVDGVTMTLTRATATSKRDYINVSVEIRNARASSIEPGFEVAAITNGKKFVTATKAKSDRRVLQPGSASLAHFEFTRPDLAAALSDMKLVVPVKNVGRLELRLTPMRGEK